MRTWMVAALCILSFNSVGLADELPFWKVGIRTQIVSNEIEFKPATHLSQVNNNLKFRPAQSNYFGVILGYRWLASTIWFSVPANPEIRAVEGESKYSDIGLSLYFKKIGIELGYNSFQGFLVDNSQDRISAGTLNGARYLKYPDMKTTGFGAKVLIPLNPERFSMSAAFEQSEIQNQSGGTWMWIGAVRYQRVSNSSAIIPTQYTADFGGDASMSHAYMVNGSWGIGYGYNWVPGAFFFSPFLGLGAGYQSTTWSTASGEHVKHSPTVNVYAKIGTGYNGRKFFLTLNVMADRFQQNTDSMQIGNGPVITTFSLGARF